MSMAPYMYRVAASAIGHPRSGGAQVAIARGAAGGATGRVGAGGRGAGRAHTHRRQQGVARGGLRHCQPSFDFCKGSRPRRRAPSPMTPSNNAIRVAVQRGLCAGKLKSAIAAQTSKNTISPRLTLRIAPRSPIAFSPVRPPASPASAPSPRYDRGSPPNPPATAPHRRPPLPAPNSHAARQSAIPPNLSPAFPHPAPPARRPRAHRGSSSRA